MRSTSTTIWWSTSASSRGDQGWISGGIFVCEPGILDYIDGDRDHLEIEPVTRLSRDYQLAA